MHVFQEKLYAGKTVVITGGGSGINLCIAEKFANLGARLVVIGRSQEKLDAAVKLLETRGAQAMGLSADVRDYTALAGVLQQAHEKFGDFDVLVCGAAGNFPALAMGMSANAFKAVIDIDTLGTFNACRASYDFLKKPGAAILNISAPQSYIPMPYQSHVCAAKAGVDMITKTLAIEWGPQGIRVNSIVPGPIEDTEGMKRLAYGSEENDGLKKSIPLQRYGKKSEIADLALFLASEAASYISGAVVVCDGGQSLLGSSAWVQSMMASLHKK